MTAKSHSRGWLIEFLSDQWVYSDTREPLNSHERPCARCKQMPTKEGYDACLGYVKGAQSSCCGHGVSEVIKI